MSFSLVFLLGRFPLCTPKDLETITMRGTGKDAVRLCEHIVRQAFGPVVCVSPPQLPLGAGRRTDHHKYSG